MVLVSLPIQASPFLSTVEIEALRRCLSSFLLNVKCHCSLKFFCLLSMGSTMPSRRRISSVHLMYTKIYGVRLLFHVHSATIWVQQPYPHCEDNTKIVRVLWVITSACFLLIQASKFLISFIVHPPLDPCDHRSCHVCIVIILAVLLILVLSVPLFMIPVYFLSTANMCAVHLTISQRVKRCDKRIRHSMHLFFALKFSSSYVSDILINQPRSLFDTV